MQSGDCWGQSVSAQIHRTLPGSWRSPAPWARWRRGSDIRPGHWSHFRSCSALLYAVVRCHSHVFRLCFTSVLSQHPFNATCPSHTKLRRAMRNPESCASAFMANFLAPAKEERKTTKATRMAPGSNSSQRATREHLGVRWGNPRNVNVGLIKRPPLQGQQGLRLEDWRYWRTTSP